MIARSKERSAHPALEVLFADLCPEDCDKVSQTSDLPLWFWPQQAFDAAVDCVLLFNREMIEILERNLNRSVILLSRIARSRNWLEVVELQAAHLNNQLSAMIDQSEEVATLSLKTTMDIITGAGRRRG
jgi:phasin protein